MKARIYKSLDEVSSTFGLKGSYWKYALVGAGVDLLVSFVVGRATQGIIGIVVFIGMLAAIYIGLMTFQAKFSERERKKWMSSKKLPDFVSVGPRPMREYLQVNERKGRH